MFQNAFQFLVESDFYFFRYSILFIRIVKSKVAKIEEKQKKHAHTINTSIVLISPHLINRKYQILHFIEQIDSFSNF